MLWSGWLLSSTVPPPDGTAGLIIFRFCFIERLSGCAVHRARLSAGLCPARKPLGGLGISSSGTLCRWPGSASGPGGGAGVTLADWHHPAGSLPPAEQQRAAQAGADVAGVRSTSPPRPQASTRSTWRWPPFCLDLAVASLLQGFELAPLLAGAILAAAGVVGFLGLRSSESSSSLPQQLSSASGR